MKRLLVAAAVCCCVSPAVFGQMPAGEAVPVEFHPESEFKIDFGADLRVRQEIMHNVPQAENGVLGRPGVSRGKTKNMFRIRPDVWVDIRFNDAWRLYARIVDEFRAGIVQKTHNQTFPCEAIFDNLYIEGKGLFDGILDIRAGRQDLYRLYGLDHIFVDGTPGDGSMSTFANMLNATIHVNETSKLDLLALYNMDQEELRWGTKRSRHISKTGYARGEREMDDWGFGAVWSSRMGFADYNLFWIQKNTAAYHRDGVKYARRQTNLLGAKFVPHWTDEFSTPVELMGQIGRNSDGDTLSGWGAYAGVDWKKAVPSGEFRPFANSGILALSGDAAGGKEDGAGHHAWDPMWYRGVDDSEMFLYGSTYGLAWWSNMVNIKTTVGAEFGPRHKAQLMAGPMFAQEKDGVGGGDSAYKGFLAQARYDFPVWLQEKKNGRGEELFGHLLFEYFAPGDYFATGKPAYFFRWQIDFKF